ncbi:hypothetical protein LCGC14_1677960 [marine sediment metagenome]|uniref:Uncharacterized protein n=1 Tax=marine sediment metagenome TaxID=412755 RepID=A0A0F9HPX8_9ZZZZ
MKICGEYRKHIVCESWQGGGIDDVAFKSHYDDGYHFAHSCQDTHDEDVFHYIFQKDDSDEPLGSCGMCGESLTTDSLSLSYSHASREEDALPLFFSNEQVDIRLAPGTRASFAEFLYCSEAKAVAIKFRAGTRAFEAAGARK